MGKGSLSFIATKANSSSGYSHIDLANLSGNLRSLNPYSAGNRYNSINYGDGPDQGEL